MSHDEDFARTLRDRLDAVAPLIDVDTTGVVPRARRHRTRVRSVGAVAAVAVLVGGGWFVDTSRWRTAQPVGPVPSAFESPSTTAAPTALASASPSPSADGWWHVRALWPSGDQLVVRDAWTSRTAPGLLVLGDDLSTAQGIGPSSVIGRFRIDGAWVDQLRDVSALPTDAAGLESVLRDSVEPGRGSGSDDDKVFGMARDLLLEGGLQPDALRLAAWDVAAGLPGATTSTGTDAMSRPGEVLGYTDETGRLSRLIRDPATGLLLEDSVGEDSVRVYIEQGPVTELPVEPTLESSGCVDWSTC